MESPCLLVMWAFRSNSRHHQKKKKSAPSRWPSCLWVSQLPEVSKALNKILVVRRAGLRSKQNPEKNGPGTDRLWASYDNLQGCPNRAKRPTHREKRIHFHWRSSDQITQTSRFSQISEFNSILRLCKLLVLSFIFSVPPESEFL
jgi:hypothetical protein